MGFGIYVASKTRHAPMWQAYRKRGWAIVSTWIDEAGPGESADLDDLWRRCIAEASGANVLVVFREGDDVLKGGWVEVGAALAAGVPVFAVGIEDFTIAKDRRIRHFPSLDEAMIAAALVEADASYPHPDDLAVDRFAAAMKAKLAAKRSEGRRSWDDGTTCTNETLTALLRNHVEKGDPVDVGNLAMMLHQRGEAIGPGGEPDPSPFVADYRNWRGEIERRWLMPIRVWFGRSEWHPEPQWLLSAWDCNRNVERDFALADFHPGHHDGRMIGERAA